MVNISQMKSKRSSKLQNHNDTHRWVISYADFITLLFAFFVVMYSISSVSESKYKSLSEGMHSAFNKKDEKKATRSTAKFNNGPEVRNTKGLFTDGMDNLKESLSDINNGSYQIKKQEGWIELNMQAGSLFDSGTADLKTTALLRLMDIANTIKGTPYTIVVEGYTDSTPIDTPDFPSNWDLSAARAAAVGRALNNFGVQSDHLIVTGYGEQYPIADNATTEGRQTNRRVSIVIVRNRQTDRLFNPKIEQIHNAFTAGTDAAEQSDHKKDDAMVPFKIEEEK